MKAGTGEENRQQDTVESYFNQCNSGYMNQELVDGDADKLIEKVIKDWQHWTSQLSSLCIMYLEMAAIQSTRTQDGLEYYSDLCFLFHNELMF